MNQSHGEDGGMPVEQVTARNRDFIPIPREGVYNRTESFSLWD